MDNIGVFDRGSNYQLVDIFNKRMARWMAMYSLNMLTIALELSKEDSFTKT